MSEKGNKYLSMTDGSDAVFECPCTPCEKVGFMEEASHYCQECKQYLCSTCTKYHTRFSATARHTLIDTATANRQGADSLPLIPTAKCHRHADRDIEMYCGTHDMVYCTLCIAKDHRSCVDVAEVGDIALSNIEEPNLHQLIDDIDAIHKKLGALKMKKKENITHTQEMKKKILTEIGEIRWKMAHHLHKLEKKATTELDEVCAKVEKELQTEVKSLEGMSSYFGQMKENLSKSMDKNDEQKFIHGKLGEKITSDASSLLITDCFIYEKKVIFIPEKDLHEIFLKATSMGHVESGSQVARRKPRDNLRVKSKKEIDVKVKDDTNGYCISDICQLPDGNILIADQNNKKVKRLDSQYNVKDYCEFEDNVVSLTYCTEQKLVAVKLYCNKAVFLAVGRQLTKTTTIELKGGANYGFMSLGVHLWVSSGNGIDICDMKGKMEKRIETNGKQMFSALTSNIAISNDSTTVFVAAWGNRVISFDRHGNIKKILHDQRLKDTRGVAVSEDGILFVSGASSKNIVMFNPDGNSLGELVKAIDCMKPPLALHYDHTKSQLFVGFEDSKIIVFELGE